MSLRNRLPLRTLTLGLFALPTYAQDFQTPGMPRRTASGQLDRFSNELNPAIGLVIDTEATYLDSDSDEDDASGFDLRLRTFELGANAWVDPNAWAYAVIVADEEEIELEEAAMHYLGLGERTNLRAGRFFVDFGKQMQGHVDELPYPERPLVLRTYLGEELAGTGVQFDHWTPTGDTSALRLSLAAFDSLADGHRHGHGGEEEEEGPEVHVGERADFDDLSFTLRLTQFMDVGENGVFQWGASARHVGAFALEDDENDLEVEDLSNTVYGVDLTYGWTDDSGLGGWTFGAEALLANGDLEGEVVDTGGGPELEILDEDVSGYYLWADRALDQYRSVGLLWSSVETPEEDQPEDQEVVLYHTRQLSEYLRLRLALNHLDREDGDDEFGVTVQLTSFLGAHAHGVNW